VRCTNCERNVFVAQNNFVGESAIIGASQQSTNSRGAKLYFFGPELNIKPLN
jgi:hypothetical protein